MLELLEQELAATSEFARQSVYATWDKLKAGTISFFLSFCCPSPSLFYPSYCLFILFTITDKLFYYNRVAASKLVDICDKYLVYEFIHGAGEKVPVLKNGFYNIRVPDIVSYTLSNTYKISFMAIDIQ